MQLGQLCDYLQALPSRDAERALLEFQASAEAWDVCLSVVAGAHGPVPQSLAIFASQSLHAAALRVPIADADTADGAAQAQHIASRQQGLLRAICHVSHYGVQPQQHCQQHGLICAAFAALCVRNLGSVRDALSAALQQLPTGLAAQLLAAVAEEAEALQARLGGDVERSAALQQVLREEVGHHVLTWLASVASTAQRPPDDLQKQQQHCLVQQQQAQQHHQGQGIPSEVASRLVLLRGVVRCFGAWVRLGCLHSGCCPVAAVHSLVELLFRAAHPGLLVAVDVGIGAGHDGHEQAHSGLRHEACEALSDVIEYGPDALVHSLQVPMTQLAAAAAKPRSDFATRDVTTADAVYDVVHVVSSYASAQQGELVSACCNIGGSGAAPVAAASPALQQPASSITVAAVPATASYEAAAAVVGSLARLAALTDLTEGGYPVSCPALQALADLALACIATTATSSGSGALNDCTRDGDKGTARPDRCGDGGEGDVMQRDDGGPARCAGGGSGPGACSSTGYSAGMLASVATAAEGHCVPNLNLQPCPRLPAPLVLLYDSVLRGVLSCCVSWSMCCDAGGDGAEAAGLLRLPSECGEALRDCLQACAGVVGQAQQLAIAVALLEQAGLSRPAAAEGITDNGLPPRLQSGPPSQAPAGALQAASLTAALAAVAACGTLPEPIAPRGVGGGSSVDGQCGGAGGSGGSPHMCMVPQADLAVACSAGVAGSGAGLCGKSGAAAAGGFGLAHAAAAAAAAVVLTASRFVLDAGGAATTTSAAPLPPAWALSAPRNGAVAASGQVPRSLLVSLWLHYCEAVAASCRAVLRSVALQGAAGAEAGCAAGLWAAAAGVGAAGAAAGAAGAAAAVAAVCEMAQAALAGLQAEASSAAAARALSSLVDAAAATGLPLPAALAERLVDAVHSLPYDVGPRQRAAMSDLLRAAVAAVRLAAAAPGLETSPAADATARLSLLHRLLSPSLTCIAQGCAAATTPPRAAAVSPAPGPHDFSTTTTPRWTRLPRHADTALHRHLGLMEALLTSPSERPTASSVPQPTAATAAHIGGAGQSEPDAADALPRRAFIEQAWPQLQVLLRQGGAAGRFLLPLCRCLKALLQPLPPHGPAHVPVGGPWPRGAAAPPPGAFGSETTFDGAAGLQAGARGGNCAEAVVADPFVVSVLETLAACVGRPGAKHVYEPLVALLEAGASVAEEGGTAAEAAGGAESMDVGWVAVFGTGHQWQQTHRHQQVLHAHLAACALQGVLEGGVATTLAANWRSADQDPDTAECLLRLATAAARHVLAEPAGDGASGAAGASNGAVPAAGIATPRASLAAAALRLAAASSGCDHRPVASLALGCTCAVLEAACGCGCTAAAARVVAPVAPGLLGPARRELVGVVVQLGPLAAAGLLGALLSSSPLPRLQKVAAGLVMLATVLALCYMDQQHQQREQQRLPGGPVAALDGPASVEACGQVLGSWLAGAAAHLQLAEQVSSYVALGCPSSRRPACARQRRGQGWTGQRRGQGWTAPPWGLSAPRVPPMPCCCGATSAD